MKLPAWILFCITLVLVAGHASGAGVTVQVSDTAGKPIDGAAVFIEVAAGKAPPASQKLAPSALLKISQL